MKLAISNIGWTEENDTLVYSFMKNYGYEGLEIAPTRIFKEKPYDRIADAKLWSDNLKSEHGFVVPSMQSIWFGRLENIFIEEEREILIEYTKKAVDFAIAIGCKNLVFGCPKNRNIVGEYNPEVAMLFFREIGNYAAQMGTVIGMEANPTIYNTNFINDTLSAFELIEAVNSEGFKLNLDMGTIIYNMEDINELVGKVHLINHVHISEPGLKPVEGRELHGKLKKILEREDYPGFISIEMGKTDEMSLLEDKMKYVKEIFA